VHELSSFVFIIGMPGSGKSSIGKLLARALDKPFYDLDRVIENYSGSSVTDFFKKYGEDKFRLLEADLLKQTVLNEIPGVLSTGGGTPCFHDSISWMKKHGNTVFLDVPLTILIERNRYSKHRPLLAQSKEEQLLSLYNKRLPVYRQAQLIFPYEEEGSAQSNTNHLVQQLKQLS